MTQVITRFDTQHAGPLHSVAFNVFGNCVATASSDHSIRVFSVSSSNNQTPQLIQQLCGHQGPVWQVCWSHPKLGNLIASCGYDQRVLIWQQQSQQAIASNRRQQFNQGNSATEIQQPSGNFVCVYENSEHQASVNCIEFAPHEYNYLLLCAGSTDGTLSLYVYDRAISDSWTRKSFSAHFNGVNALSWAPARYAIDNVDSSKLTLLPPLIASAGSDNQVRLWVLDMDTWELCEAPSGLPMEHQHKDWVRGIAFQPIPPSGFLMSSDLILASCGEDKTVRIWSGKFIPSGNLQISSRNAEMLSKSSSKYEWKHVQTIHFDAPVWSLSWSVSGTLLCCATGDESVIVLRENVQGKWECITDVKDALAVTESAPQQATAADQNSNFSQTNQQMQSQSQPISSQYGQQQMQPHQSQQHQQSQPISSQFGQQPPQSHPQLFSSHSSHSISSQYGQQQSPSPNAIHPGQSHSPKPMFPPTSTQTNPSLAPSLHMPPPAGITRTGMNPPPFNNMMPPQNNNMMSPQNNNMMPPQNNNMMSPQNNNMMPPQNNNMMPPQNNNMMPPQNNNMMPPQNNNMMPPFGAPPSFAPPNSNMPPYGNFPPQNNMQNNMQGYPPSSNTTTPPTALWSGGNYSGYPSANKPYN